MVLLGNDFDLGAGLGFPLGNPGIKRFILLAANQLGLPLMASNSAIQPLRVGDATQATAMSQTLRERGLLIGAIRPPTVPPGTSRLRITLSAAHSPQQVDRLLEELALCQKQSI